MITVHEITQGSKEWHEIREGKYTGSNAHKLLKFGRSAFAITEESNFRGNFHTRRGHLLEDEAIELYETITKHSVDRPGFVTNSLFDNCGYSPDGLDGQTLLEVKCFSEAKHLKLYNGDIPLEVLAQIYFGMLICGLKQAKLIIYNPELDPKLAFKIIDVKYRPAILNNFKRILKEPAHV